MSLELKIDSNKLRKNSGLYVIIILIFVAVFYFYYSTGTKFYAAITKTLKDTRDIKFDINSIQAKISSLKTINKDSTPNVNALNIAFQSDDPSLFMYSQLKILSFNNKVEIMDIVFSQGPPVDDISVSVITFKVRGIKEDVLNFITALGKIAPLSGLGSMSFLNYVETGGLLEINTSVNLYYSPLPKVLPDTGKIVNNISGEEKSIYDTLTGLEILSQSNFVAQNPGGEDVNPFNNVATASAEKKE